MKTEVEIKYINQKYAFHSEPILFDFPENEKQIKMNSDLSNGINCNENNNTENINNKKSKKKRKLLFLLKKRFMVIGKRSKTFISAVIHGQFYFIFLYLLLINNLELNFVCFSKPSYSFDKNCLIRTRIVLFFTVTIPFNTYIYYCVNSILIADKYKILTYVCCILISIIIVCFLPLKSYLQVYLLIFSQLGILFIFAFFENKKIYRNNNFLLFAFSIICLSFFVASLDFLMKYINFKKEYIYPIIIKILEVWVFLVLKRFLPEKKDEYNSYHFLVINVILIYIESLNISIYFMIESFSLSFNLSLILNIFLDAFCRNYMHKYLLIFLLKKIKRISKCEFLTQFEKIPVSSLIINGQKFISEYFIFSSLYFNLITQWVLFCFPQYNTSINFFLI